MRNFLCGPFFKTYIIATVTLNNEPKTFLFRIATLIWPVSSALMMWNYLFLQKWPKQGSYKTENFSAYIKKWIWLHFDWILAVFWLYFDWNLIVFWVFFNCILTAFWLHFDCILTEFWLQFDWILTAFWLHFDLQKEIQRCANKIVESKPWES